MACPYSKLPIELVSEIFKHYLKDKDTPILHYPTWAITPCARRQWDPHNFDGSIYEPWTTTAPTPLPSAERSPKLISDPPLCHEFFTDPAACYARHVNDHALYDVYKPFQAEYIRLLNKDRTLIMMDIELDVLKDRSRWAEITAPDPLPTDAKFLYIRLASSSALVNPKLDTLWPLIEVIKQFPKLKFLSLDAVHNRSRPGFAPRPSKKIAATIGDIRMDDSDPFPDLKQLFILKTQYKWVYWTSEGFGDYDKFKRVKKSCKSTRGVWREYRYREREAAELARRWPSRPFVTPVPFVGKGL